MQTPQMTLGMCKWHLALCEGSHRVLAIFFPQVSCLTMFLYTCSFSGDIHVLGACSPQHANQEVLKQGYHYKRGHANIVGYFPCMALCTYNILTMTVFFVFDRKFA